MATELHSSPRGIGAVLALTAALHVAAFGPVAAQAGPGAMVPPASPEAGDSRSRAWVSLGLTWAAFPEDIRADVGLLGALTFQRGPHHVSLRGIGFTEIVSGADNVVELAALYGRTRSGSWAHAAAAVGLAAVVVGRGSPPEAAADIPIETLRAIVVLHPVEGSLVHGTAGGGGAVLLFRK